MAPAAAAADAVMCAACCADRLQLLDTQLQLRQSTIKPAARAHLRPCNVHAMAPCIEQLWQLHKCLNLVTAPATDDSCREQMRHLPDCVAHLQHGQGQLQRHM
jgi:hypothetical protein